MGKTVDYLEILSNIEDIQNGDIVYVISDILNLGLLCLAQGKCFEIQKFIDSILEKVGPDGTVLFPTFNWDFCKGKTFDYKKTISKTGALGNAALKRSDCRRSKHPIYSFAIWGKYQRELTEMDPKDSFGPDTIFEFLHRNHAKALIIGLDTMKGLTFSHYVEEVVGVPYRYLKDFTAGYIDEENVYSERTYSMYVRDLDMDPQYNDSSMGMILEQLGVSKNLDFGGIPFHVVNLEVAFEVIKIDITCNDSANLYIYNHPTTPPDIW